jgi:energy-coupling factor transport system permease protein
VHALDARAKLVAALLLVSAAVLGRTLASQALLLGLLVASFALARLPPGVLLRGARGALWLALFVAAANTGWFLVTRHASWATGEASIQQPLDLLLLLTRLFNLLLVAALVTATTVPVDAAEGLERLLRPLERLRIPVHELGFLLVLALSFVPLFWREARRLADGHRIKVGAARWSFLDRARAAVPLLVPLFLGVLRHADDLAVALDARGFVPGAPRTSLVAAHAGWREAAALGVGAAALVACVLLRP